MFMRYKPEGASAETVYEFRPERTDFGRAATAEKIYSRMCGERRTWEQFVAEAKMGSIAARKVALWLAITDVHPMTRFEDVAPNLRVGELGMEYSHHELVEMRAALAENTDMVESEKTAMLASLDREIETALVGKDEPTPEAEVESEPPGKDEETDDPSTS